MEDMVLEFIRGSSLTPPGPVRPPPGFEGVEPRRPIHPDAGPSGLQPTAGEEAGAREEREIQRASQGQTTGPVRPHGCQGGRSLDQHTPEGRANEDGSQISGQRNSPPTLSPTDDGEGAQQLPSLQEQRTT